MPPRRSLWSAAALAALWCASARAADEKLAFAFTCTVPENNQPVCPKTGPRCTLKDHGGAEVTLELPYQLYDGASRPDPDCAGIKLGDFPAGSSCYSVTDLPNYVCDFLRASGPPSGFDAVFNALPTFAAQKAAIFQEIDSADTAYSAWFGYRVKADPSKMPASLSDAKKMKKLSSMFNDAYAGLEAVSKPFLWPPPKPDSYIYGEDRSDPWTYADYLFNRPSPSQSAAFSAIYGAMDAIKQKQLSAARKAVARALPRAMSFQDLNASFDGSRGGDGAADTLSMSPGGSPPAAAGKGTPGTTSHAPSDLALPSVPPPPAGASLLPKKLSAIPDLGIFNRGYADGVQRLKELAAMMAAHARGKTYTLGDPLDRAANGFHQLSGSCGVGSQYQALASRGKIVPMAALTKTAEAHGWYVEINNANTPDDPTGGTPFHHEGKLLALYGVPNRVVRDADAAALDKWLLTSPTHDTIVDVKAKILWNDSKLGDSVDHDVYVSGVEVDRSSGKIAGYYINDTGTGEAGRFVPAATFLSAWGRDFVEIGARSPAPAPTPAVTTIGGAS